MNINFLKNIFFVKFFLLIVLEANAQENSLNNLTRQQKDTMTVCPLHKKIMPMSDNYRANAADIHEKTDKYPFAYHLNYRRYCKTCTKTFTSK
ncbi:MAG: hypothetical protein SFU27_11085 [Thermonemataceae bacterium]|nr:hypothetical protein [Thermonemataceae bacterium]